MNRKLGLFMMILGALAVIASVALFLINEHEDRMAKEYAEQGLKEVRREIEIYVAHATPTPEVPEVPEEWKEEPTVPKEMKVVTIDGLDYIGYLSIPAIGIELPIFSDWSYPLLKKSPCRYKGSTGTHNLVLAAHNYKTHFGKLHTISPGTEVYFTDMEGRRFSYVIESVEEIKPTAINDMIITPYELTLFTCTYGGRARVAVRCRQTDVK